MRHGYTGQYIRQRYTDQHIRHRYTGQYIRHRNTHTQNQTKIHWPKHQT